MDGTNIVDGDAEPAKKFFFKADAARKFVALLLERNGAPPSTAAQVAKCLVKADLRGVDTHGMNMLPAYIESIRKGVLDPTVQPTLRQVTPVVAHVDGQNGFSYVAAKVAMDAAIKSAEVYGIGMASVAHSNHLGMGAWVVQQAIDANMMSLVFTNSSPTMTVWGGASKRLGGSPIACGAPGKDHPFILDMAPSVVAIGTIVKAKRRGEKIPFGWALDSQGRPTEDPEEALNGFMLPVGGAKGAGLSVMMDVFSGVLSGSAYAGHVCSPYEPTRPGNVGHLLVAIKPNLFMSLEDFKERMQYLYERIVTADKAPGVDRVYFPGEMKQLRERERLESGIPMTQAEIDALNKEAALVGSKPLSLNQE